MPLFRCIYLFFYISFSLGLCIFLKVYFCFHILWVSNFFEWGVGVGSMPLFKCIYFFNIYLFSLGLRLFLKGYFCFHVLCLGFGFFSFFGGGGVGGGLNASF